MDDLLSEFLTETAENLSVLDVELVQLEQNPNDPDLLSNIFRLVHTIKGTCGFLGLPRLESVAHASENILGKFRDGEIEVSPQAVSLILESLDKIKDIVSALEDTGSEPEGNDQDLIDRLNAFAENGGDVGENSAPVEAAAPTPEQEAVKDDSEQILVDGGLSQDALDDFDRQVEEALAAKRAAEAATAAAEVAAEEKAEADKVEAAADTPKKKEKSVSQQSLRVNVDLLENLMTMVSELVLTRNQLMQILRSQKESEFATPLQRLNHVTSELQEGVMKTRMQPIGNAWAKLPRIVRDLSLELNKKIELQMIGAETELDRQVLELIKDPLTHMVRNSADHGLEKVEERIRSGKSEVGHIRLNAYHEGGHILIEIADDGRGLSVDRIRKKVVANGLATEEEAAKMTDLQVQQMIFKAGFSTAQTVTSVSGRGVGMDVVRTNIEKIGGTIELKSIEGQGTTFIIKIPLTLAIVSALIVECAQERFAIPQLSVVELVRTSAQSEYKVEKVSNTPVLRLRNRLLPLVSLKKLLKLDNGSSDTEINDNGEAFIVVAQVGTYTFGIIVDRVFDTEEIVVKPVAPIIRNIDIFSGNTILGDGSVIMILDPNGIAAATGEITVDDSMDAEAEARRAERDDLMSLLLFRTGQGAPKAVPLGLIARLEDIERDTIEYSNGLPVVQYRGKLMPLVSIDHSMEFGGEGRQPILVFTDGERSMGLMVSEIVDIVEEKLSVELETDMQGLMGSAIISGKATDVIDVGFYLTQAYEHWFDGQRSAYTAVEKKYLLLVDDSLFFRNLLEPVLSVAGYEVTTAKSGAEALELLEKKEFDVVVSDIEMPEMSGFDLAKKIREEGSYSHIPLVALSSFSTPKDLDRGRDAGFTDYVAKFDRDALLVTLSHTLSTKKNDARGVA